MEQLSSRIRLSHRALSALLALMVAAAAVLPLPGVAPVAQAQTLVPVQYDSFNKIIYVGDDYNAADPAQAPFVGYPSAPTAPKSDITLDEIDDALTALGHPDLLVKNGGAWLLTDDTVISQTARLNVANTELRLDSDPSSGKFPALTKLIARGGWLNFQSARVLSWSGGAPDTDFYDGRSFLLAELGGRMDIVKSEVSHLGWSAGEPSGLSWRKTGTKGDPRDPDIIKTGATGSILDSKIHSNYFGQYSYEAYGLVAKNNHFYDNYLYGFDPHDYSTGFEVAYNKVYNNGKHGIIFSRHCTLNRIHHNEVFNNAEHGIMLDRGTNVNQITDNLVYNNRDGIAIFQSEKNLIKNNILRGNERGVRINATFDLGDEYDGLANENVVINNTIEDSSQYGIYFYERADKNTIERNTISGSAASGIYIKTGGNLINGNIIRTNDNGITIVGGEPITPGGLQPSYAGGYKNTITGNTIEDNNSIGIQLKGAVDTVIGVKSGPTAKPADANIIRTNGTHGVSLDTSSFGGVVYGSTKNVIIGNTIHANLVDGVLIKGAESIKNLVSRNSITVNGRSGISLAGGANQGVIGPKITSAADATVVTGTALDAQGKPEAGTVEVYRDGSGQGQFYLGSTTINPDGSWSFALPATDNPDNGAVTALVIDKYNNTSPFGGNAVGGSLTQYAIGTGANGETTVYISGPGSNVTLPDIERALKTITDTTLLAQEDSVNKVWMSNVSLFLNRGVTLTLTSETVSWLKLRSQNGDIQLSASETEPTYNYKSFTTLRTYNGSILIDGVRITSWDPFQGTYDTDITNGRSYVLAKYNARMDIKNADLSYLGSADGESYGISWRDINSSEQPDVMLTRVTGDVINSTFSNNYYGIYTFQASYMKFVGNKFHHNIGYGFDPHDFTHHVLVENNESFENGNHGFIISRGCNNFVIRNNKSYNNRYTVGTDDRKAHGFMLDPGSPNSRFPQEPSFNNLLEKNQAWGNDGYGLRIVGSISNTVQLNTFTGGYQGITLEQGSTGNIIKQNTIAQSTQYGIYLTGGSDNTTVSQNTITKSGKHGIYVKTGKNTIDANTITDNGTLLDGVRSGAGIATYRESDFATAAADLGLTSSAGVAAAATDLASSLAKATEVDGNRITNNTVLRNVDDGIEVKSATNSVIQGNTVQNNGSHGVYLSSGAGTNMLKGNTISDNGGHGIRANGTDVFGNTWSQNKVYANMAGGIINTSSANNGIKPPTLSRSGNTVTGTAAPGATVELYSDGGGQGRNYETSVRAGDDGTFKVTRAWKAGMVNATMTDGDGNTSGFTYNVAMYAGGSRVYLPLVSQPKAKK